jgi:hypothetical protein
MSSNLKGGLILNDKALQLGLSGFEPVVKMLLSSGTRINVLTANSLKGFMFTLNVNDNDSTYRHFKFINGGQNITNFIIKIVVITERKHPLPKFNGTDKSSETVSSFLTEARLQQTIWLRNIIGGKPEFTPSIANFALFDKGQSSNLLKCLTAKSEDDDTMNVIRYLSKFHSWNLGVLLMPMINNSVTLYNYALTHPDDNEQLLIAYSNTIANIVKLFIIVHVIHWDLHLENAMIVDDAKEKSFLIDFGSASNIRKPINDDHVPDDYINKEKKGELYKFAQESIEKFLSIRKTKRNYTNLQEEEKQKEQKDKEKSEFMEDVCRRLGEQDRIINGERLKGEYKAKGLYQMKWIESIYNSPDKDKVFLRAYKQLERDYLTSSVKITIKTINSYIKTGKIFDLDSQEESTYYYEFPEDIVESLPELPSPRTTLLELQKQLAAQIVEPPIVKNPPRALSRSMDSIYGAQYGTPSSTSSYAAIPPRQPYAFQSSYAPQSYASQSTIEDPQSYASESTIEDPQSYASQSYPSQSYASQSYPSQSSTLEDGTRIRGGKTKKKKNKKRKTLRMKSRRKK